MPGMTSGARDSLAAPSARTGRPATASPTTATDAARPLTRPRGSGGPEHLRVPRSTRGSGGPEQMRVPRSTRGSGGPEQMRVPRSTRLGERGWRVSAEGALLIADRPRGGQPAAAAPELTLVCVPHAGGSAAAFRPWVRAFAGTGVAVRPVQWAPYPDLEPGRDLVGSRTLLARAAALGDELRRMTGPYVLLGHSLGAVVATEVVRLL